MKDGDGSGEGGQSGGARAVKMGQARRRWWFHSGSSRCTCIGLEPSWILPITRHSGSWTRSGSTARASTATTATGSGATGTRRATRCWPPNGRRDRTPCLLRLLHSRHRIIERASIPGCAARADDADADWFLLADGDAALPASATILDALPAGARARVVLEVVDEHEERPLSTAAQVDITCLLDPLADQADTALEAAVRAIDLPPGNGRIYVGCEAAAMRRIRAHLLHERGLDRATIVRRGYWKLDAVDYTDHDYGTDD